MTQLRIEPVTFQLLAQCLQLEKCTNYKAPHYAVFSIFLLLQRPDIQIFSLVPFH